MAAKCLHNVIISEYNLHIFSCEMTIISQLCHPNLLLFIGVTTQGQPPIIILTEFMATSLRAEISQRALSNEQIKSIDGAFGLNYLHLWKLHPIIHRHVILLTILFFFLYECMCTTCVDYFRALLFLECMHVQEMY